MIRVFKNWKSYKDFPDLAMKKIQDVKKVVLELGIKIWEVPEYCEEPYQYFARKNGFNLSSY